MRILRILGIVLLVLIGLVLIVGAVMPKEVNLTRSVTIDAPQEAVYNTVANLRSWPEWNPWAQADSTMEWTFGATTEGAGAYYTWTSENSGDGRMDITDTSAPDSLSILVAFDGQGDATGDFVFRPAGNATETSWSFHSDFPFPFNAMLLFMDMEGLIGADYERGLQFLKEYVEANYEATPAMNIERIDHPGTYYLTKRGTMGWDEMDAYYQEAMPALHMAVTEKGHALTGQPATLTYVWDEENQVVDMALGMPVAPGTKVEGLEAVEISAGPALKVDYYGPYGGVGVAHAAIAKYIEDNSLNMKLPIVEVYVTDPGEEPDTSKWLTQVMYMLEQ